MTQVTQDREIDYLSRFQEGNRTFSLMITRWMDGNEWSHPTMVSLAKAALNGAAWIHSSQINGLRHNKLASPGPRTFVALERLNYYIWRYHTEKKLIPNTLSSNAYVNAVPITEEGNPPPLGWWLEVFTGGRTPKDFDYQSNYFSDTQAESFSRAWGGLFRQLLLDKRVDLVLELNRVIRESYPARDYDRVEQLIDVIHNRRVWTGDDLARELPALSQLTAQLGGPATENDLLKQLNARLS